MSWARAVAVEDAKQTAGFVPAAELPGTSAVMRHMLVDVRRYSVRPAAASEES